MAALTFVVEHKGTKPGEAVFVVGSTPELGGWDPTKALSCITTAQVFPLWTSETVSIAAGTEKVEFKVLVQKADGSKPDQASWDPGPNRSLHVPKSTGGQVQLTASCCWGSAEVTCRSKTVGAGSAAAAPAPAQAAPAAVIPRVDTAAPWFSMDEEAGDGESGDQVPDMKPVGSFARKTPSAKMSGHNDGTLGGIDGRMDRRKSRHLCMDSNGMLNTELSRTPSMMLVDFNDMHEECDSKLKEVEALEERQRLNQMQRRMQSGTLLEGMKQITDYADLSKTFMLQGFNWESWRAGAGDWYSMIAGKADMLADMGFTDIWFPPCSASVAPQGYLPSQLFNLDDSKYGTQASLESCLKKLKEVGIRGVADIVVNHRCGDKKGSDGKWNQFTTGMTSRPSFAGVMDWGGWAITLGDSYSDGTGEHRPGGGDGQFSAAPNIDHRNEKVQQSISIWLRWLRLQVGFQAWRFDFVKGYAAEFVGHYCYKSEPAWAVGELWGDMSYDDSGLSHNQDKHRQDLCNWINATDKRSTAFDFTTKGILQEACRNTQYWRLKDANGKPPGLIGWMPKHAVTFIDNHDTGSTQRHWPFPDDKVLIGYAYIITHPGIPCIFWDHVMDWGEDHRRKMAELMKARRDSNIPSDAPVNILTAEADLYLAEIGSPPALRVALGPRGAGDADGNYWSSGPSGRGYRIWVKKQAEVAKPAPKQEAPKPAPAPAPAPAPTATKSNGKGSDLFEPITIDGTKYTPEALQSMDPAGLQKLKGRLEPVLDATNQALSGSVIPIPRTKGGGGSWKAKK